MIILNKNKINLFLIQNDSLVKTFKILSPKLKDFLINKIILVHS